MILPFESDSKLLKMLMYSDGSNTNNMQILVGKEINTRLISESKPEKPIL